jgi:hypothetical protein
MRYRKLAQPPNINVFNYQGGDYVMGHGSSDFWINVPDAPAQAALTRMYLFLGDWFLDTSDGTPWNTQVLGHYTRNTRDPAIQSRILGTQGVKAILVYSSNVARDTRAFTVNAEIDTIYGAISIPTSPANISSLIPVNVMIPTISGIVQVGQTLVATDGMWTNIR